VRRRPAVPFSPRAVARAAPWLLAVAVLLVACGEGDDGDAGPSQTAAPTTTAAPGTTAAPSTTSTTIARTTSTTVRSTQGTVRCSSVGFTPNSDNVASEIVATGLSCTEAEALVRAVGGPLGPGGPERASANGFTCVLTGRSSEGLESATYECTNGARKVTFRRT
jgi:hypothetical protein